MPNVSVLIPVYNGIQFLEDCVDSILAQTFTEYDIHIGINGHGKDGGTAYAIAILLAEKDRRIHVHNLAQVSNKVDALNTMLGYTDSPWIALCDCDDKWLPEKLEKQMLVLDHADVIGTGATYFGEHTGQPHIPCGAFDGSVCAQVNPFVNSSVLLRRELCFWKYPEYVQALEDYYLWMRLALEKCRFYNLGAPLTLHRVYKGSAFNSKHIDEKPLLAWFAQQQRSRPMRI